MIRLPVRRRELRMPTLDAQRSATLVADSVPARWLHDVPVVGPCGEPLGRVTLVVRRPDGLRVAVLRSQPGKRPPRVVPLCGARLDASRVLHVRSSVEVDLIAG